MSPDALLPPLPNCSLKRQSVFLSYRIGDWPAAGLKRHPWEVVNTDGVLINAFDLIANRRTRRVAQAWRDSSYGAKEILGFSGPVWLDSGAFNFLNHPEITISPLQVWETAMRYRPDSVVALDHPFVPGLDSEEIRRRIRTSVENAVAMAERATSGNPCLVPVMHGHSVDTLETCYEELQRASLCSSGQIGIGSLATMAKFGSIRAASVLIRHAAEITEGDHLHVFSVGSPLLMHFAYYCGAASVDTQAWILSAAFKQVFVPGRAQIRLAEREIEENRRDHDTRLEQSTERLTLESHKGLILKDWESGVLVTIRDEIDAREYLLDMVDRPGRPRIHHRACHNAQVMAHEASSYRRASDKGEFLLCRTKHSPYRKAAESLIERTLAGT